MSGALYRDQGKMDRGRKILVACKWLDCGRPGDLCATQSRLSRQLIGSQSPIHKVTLD